MRAPGRRWGIVVGVDNYENAGTYLHDLKGCVADAHKMYNVMTDRNCCGFLEDNVRLLDNPTYGEIESAFVEIGEKMRRGDELWFYFAGHGYSERRRNGESGYLLPSDVELREDGKLLTRSCISHSGLRDDLIARNIGHGNITVVLFFDCCCAAAVGLNDGNRAVGVDERQVSEGFTESFRDLGVVGGQEDGEFDFKYISFMATGKSGKAKEDASGGVFTKYLIEGLRGGRPEFSTVGPGSDDYLIRVGNLGVFLGNYVPNQPPLQDFVDPTYPLSASSERKSIHEQMRKMDKNVSAWLLGMMEGGYVSKEIKRFAQDIIDEYDAADFKYAGALRNLMRLFSNPENNLPIGLKEGAVLVGAFHELKTLMDGAGAVPVEKSPSEQRRQSAKAAYDGHLSRADLNILSDVQNRLSGEEEPSAALAEIDQMDIQDAVEAFDAMARKRFRKCCSMPRYAPLYTANEQAAWSLKARKGFSSRFEAAVYEFVRDDKALSKR